MQVKPTTRIDRLPAKSHSHYEISNVLVKPNGDGVDLVATNGHALAIVHAEGKADSEVFLPVEAWKDHHKQPQHEITAKNDRWETNKGRWGKLPDQTGTFPGHKDIIPAESTAEGDEHTMVALDVSVLCTLAEALGSNAVVLCITGERQPIGVMASNYNTNYNVPQNIGAMMPIDPGDDIRGAYREARFALASEPIACP